MKRAALSLFTSCALACGPLEGPQDAMDSDAASADVLARDAQDSAPADNQAPPLVLPTTAELLPLRTVNFNPSNVALGDVAAVAESSGTTAFFGSTGLRLLRAGALVGSDPSVTQWRHAAAVPAGFGTGTWMLGVDGTGQVFRVRPDNLLERVGDRYGIEMLSVRSVWAGDATHVGFASDTLLVVADGMRIQRYMEGPFTSFSAGSGLFAGAGADRVKVLNAATNTLRAWQIPGVTEVALDARGRVHAASRDVLWVESDRGTIEAHYRAPAPIRGLIRSGSRVWFVSGDELSTVENGVVTRSRGQVIPANSRLAPASMDEVWVLTTTAPRRVGIDTGMLTPEAVWRATIQPIYAGSCGTCHHPGGQSPDLSVFSGWDGNRALIRSRVLMMSGAPMPPNGLLTPAQLMTLRTWL
ncbi:MAG: cytochrome c [Deltaproteobacteria bacterium]|nr:cytochrome c [Deltaproteobacteria bacterium]